MSELENDQLMALCAMFAGLGPDKIGSVLAKAGGDVDRAVDELLTYQVLLQQGEIPKGVDGFVVSDSEQAWAAKKTKGKKGKRHTTADGSLWRLQKSSTTTTSTVSSGQTWAAMAGSSNSSQGTSQGTSPGTSHSGSQSNGSSVVGDDESSSTNDDMGEIADVSFIMDVLEVSFDDAAALYYQGSLSRAAGVLIFFEAFESIISDPLSDQDERSVAELERRYPLIRPSLLKALWVVLRSTQTDPVEVAALLQSDIPTEKLQACKVPSPKSAPAANKWSAVAKPADSQKVVPISKPAAGTAVDVANENRPFVLVERHRARKAKSEAEPMAARSLNQTAAYQDETRLTNVLYARSAESSAYASALRRRGGRNDPIRQGAHVWSERSREHRSAARVIESNAADLRAKQQSTASSIDLHGMKVEDGMRIARAAVQAWWNGLQTKRRESALRGLAGGGAAGRGKTANEEVGPEAYTIITGVGRHSAGGVPRMRQSVRLDLDLAGWDLEAREGQLIVKGKKA